MDRLAATGMRFDNFFCASPVCSPARGTILTGRIPSQHGVHDWLAAGNTVAPYETARGGELIEYLKDMPGYTDFLAAAGYRCALSGKWHLGDCHHPQKSFEFWAAHAKGGGGYYGAQMIRDGRVYEEPRYVTNAITDNALQWLEQQKGSDRPFYLSVHYTAPHSPWTRENHPAELYDRYHEGCAFESVPEGLTPPAWVRRRSIPVDDAASRRRYLSGYYAAVTAMDCDIGRLLDWLEANGLRETTLVVFTSDNGMNMGHHGVFGKGNATFPLNMFEESVKVPFIVSQPGAVRENTRCDELVSQYDVLPTVLEYAGVPRRDERLLPGRSFCGAMRGQAPAGHEHVVVFDEYGPVRMVRTREAKYVHRYPYGPHELYDLRNDPGETTDLAGKPESRNLQREMRQRLVEWFARYADPDRDGAHEAVTGRGQVCRCGRSAEGEEAFLQWDDRSSSWDRSTTTRSLPGYRAAASP
jgi:arylsulfatase A-like enzyme